MGVFIHLAQRFALLALGRAWTLFGEEKLEARKCSKCGRIPSVQ